MYKNKYLKYKNKYLELKTQSGGSFSAAGDKKDDTIIPFFIDLTNLIKSNVPNNIVPEIISNIEGIVGVKGSDKIIKEKRTYVIKIEKLLTTNIINNLFTLLTQNNIIIYITDIESKTEHKPVDISEVKYIMSLQSRKKIALKFYYDDEETLLQKSEFLNLKNIKNTYKTLYKCDYNFTNVQYKAKNDSFRRIPTTFDSGNDAITLVDDETVQKLDLKRNGINIQPINIIMFNEIINKIDPRKMINVDTNDIGKLIELSENITITNFINNYINPNASEIRRINRILPNEDNEDLLELFGFTGFKGIGGKSKISKEFVFLAFKIEGINNKFYIKAEINNNINGVLFSKNDMALLEQQGLAFGYFEKFKEKHENLNKLKERYKTLITQYELSKHLTNLTIFGKQRDIVYQLQTIQAEIQRILSSETTPVVNIYDTLPECRNFNLVRSQSFHHTDIEFNPSEEEKQNVIEKISLNNNKIHGLLIDMIISNEFTEEQLKKISNKLDSLNDL